MPNYANGKVYTIRCKNDDTLIYVGSTTQSLAKRWGGHKTTSKIDVNRLIYSTINNNWKDWFIELYEKYPCENKEQLNKREGEVIREIGTLNKQIAGRDKQEWAKDNKDKLKEYMKNYIQTPKYIEYDRQRRQTPERIEYNKDKSSEYQQQNKDHIKEQRRGHYQLNKDRIKEQAREYRQRKKLEKENLTI